MPRRFQIQQLSLLGFSFMVAVVGWACAGQASTCPETDTLKNIIPFSVEFFEPSSVESCLVTITDITLPAGQHGNVFFEDPGDIVSDTLVLRNVGGQATICFSSDPQGSSCSLDTASGGFSPVTVVEAEQQLYDRTVTGTGFSFVVLAGSDNDESLTRSDSLQIVPEAPTLVTLGSALCGLLLLGWLYRDRIRLPRG